MSAHCNQCGGTGMMQVSEYLDCTHCDAAQAIATADKSFLAKEQARERQDELEGITYWDIFEQIDTAREAAWDFATPYLSNSTSIHKEVMQRLKVLRGNVLFFNSCTIVVD